MVPPDHIPGCAQAWSAAGARVPITVIELQDVQVCKVRTPSHDGVCALQLGGGWQKRKQMAFHDARRYEKQGLAYKRYLREFPVTEDALLPVGTSITARHFVEIYPSLSDLSSHCASVKP